jgi:hypothetical protein
MFVPNLERIEAVHVAMASQTRILGAIIISGSDAVDQAFHATASRIHRRPCCLSLNLQRTNAGEAKIAAHNDTLTRSTLLEMRPCRPGKCWHVVEE